MSTGLAVLLNVQAKITIRDVKERPWSGASECSQEQDSGKLHTLSFVGKDVDIRGPVILDHLLEIVSLQ